MKILVIGYPYTRSNYRAALESANTYFILPKIWKIKGGKVKYRTESSFHVTTTWAPFYHSNYPLIGGLLKGWMPMFPWLLWRIKCQHGIKLVFEAHEPTLLTTLYHGITVKLLGLKHIVFSWENIPFESKLSGPKGLVHRILLSLNLALSDGVVCGNEKCLEIFKKITNKPLVRIPLAGLDPERFKPQNPRLSHEDITLVFAGAIDRRKGLHILLPAFHSLLKAYPKTRLIIIGSGSYEREFSEQILELGVTVARLPWVDHARLIGILSQSDIFVYPSIAYGGWEEQFGYSMAEASLMELPVVATRSGSIEEIVKDGETGTLVDPDNVGQLTRELMALVSDRSRREVYGRAGREFIIRNFSNEIVAGQYRKFFYSLM